MDAFSPAGHNRDLPVFWESCVCDRPAPAPGLRIINVEDTAIIWPQGPCVMLVSLRMRRRLEAAGCHPLVADSPWHFRPSWLLGTCPDRMLSPDMFLLPFGALLNAPGRLPDRFFIRPDSGDKSFPGQVISRTEITLLRQSYRHVGEGDLVCIARPREIRGEMRCLVDPAAGRMIASSPYGHGGMVGEEFSIDLQRDFPLDRPDIFPDVVVADFALSSDGVRLVEVNSISTSGLYAINPRTVIDYLADRERAFTEPSVDAGQSIVL